MTSDDDAAPRAGVPSRSYVRFSAKVAREICWRTAAGETQEAICADAGMPNAATLWRWARKRAGFAKAYGRARAMGGVSLNGRAGFCPLAAREIVARVSGGEMLSVICADAHLPAVRTVMTWRADHPEFGNEMRLAREALAERFSDMGWKMAMEATPATAYLTRVRMGQLRWTAAVLGPRTHGRLKPTEAPEPQAITTICFRHFKLEVHPETGQHRVVGYTPDPDNMLPMRTSEGPWKDPPAVIAEKHRVAGTGLRAAPALENAPDDPEGWC